jgi:hypothetical protein
MIKLLHKIPKTRPVRAIYQCECGNEFTALASNVTMGKTKSCGCLRKRMALEKMANNKPAFSGGNRVHGKYEPYTY